jgi:hypothetical protein
MQLQKQESRKKCTLLGQLEVSRGEGLFQEILDLVKPKGFEPSTHHPSLYIQTYHRRNIRQLWKKVALSKKLAHTDIQQLVGKNDIKKK